jgi:hypothetical protein
MASDLQRPSERLAQRVRSARTPERLYHYTSQAGCIGIFHAQRIWATNVRFFNDEKEFVLAHDIAHEYLQELDATSSQDESWFFRRLLDEFAVTSTETYVTSFSAEGDLLSQWRGYAASGYSIGFSGTRLAEATAPDCLLAPCVYKEEYQAELVREAANGAAEHYRTLLANGEPNDKAIEIAIEEFQASLAILAPIIKHGAFQEEGEWRLIVTSIGRNSGRLCFRPGRSMITPYVELPLARSDEVLYLEEVIVGPTPHPETAELAVWMLQMHTRVGVGDVRLSDVPYRDW